MKKISIALMLVLLVAAGCDSEPKNNDSTNNTQTESENSTENEADAGDSVEMTVIEKGFYSNYTDKKNLLITNQKDLEEMWNKAHALVQPAPSAPKIDFSKEVVVAVFMGQKNTGGYGITIEEVMAKGSTLEVQIKETTPDSDSVTTQALTQPFHIVKVEGTYSKADFVVMK